MLQVVNKNIIKQLKNRQKLCVTIKINKTVKIIIK